MASQPTRWATSEVVKGEVAAQRRPRLDAMLMAKKPGLTARDILRLRMRGADAFFQSALENAKSGGGRLRMPREVDDEDVKLRVDQHVWQSLLDEDEHGEFPWARVTPPRSKPSEPYAYFFMKNAPEFEYPPLEDRTRLWAELLNEAPYNAKCGPFEVLLPAFAVPLVNRGVLHSLLDGLPAGLRIATKPVDAERPRGLRKMAMSLKDSMMGETAFALQSARVKSDLVRCFLVLRLWAASLTEEASTPLEEYFVEAYRRDLAGVANLFPGYHAPASPGPSGFVEGEDVPRLALPAPVAPPPAVEPPSAGPSPAGPPASEPSRGGSSAGPASRGGPRGGVSRGGPRGGVSRGGPRGGVSRGESSRGGPSRGGRGGTDSAREARGSWADAVVEDDETARVQRNQENERMEQELRAQGRDWSDLDAPIHETHLKTKEGEDGARVADGQSSTVRDGKGKQREDAAHGGDE